MKKLYLICLLKTFCAAVSAQTIFDTAVRYRMSSPTFEVAADTLIARAATDAADTLEGGNFTTLRRWREFIGNRISNDVPIDSDMYAPYGSALNAYMAGFSSSCASSAGSWTCLGPFNSTFGTNFFPGDAGCEHQGRVNSIWVNPSDTNVILLGSDDGGLWKTTDAGLHWHNITDGSILPGSIGITSIAVDPLDSNIIYLAAGMGFQWQYGKSNGYSLGLVYSTNGGATWNQDAAFNSLVGCGPVCSQNVTKVAYMPGTSKLFVLYDDKVLCKSNSSSTWADISPTIGRRVSDIDFTRQTPGKAAVCIAASGGISDIGLYDTLTGIWGHLGISIPSSGTTTYVLADGQGPMTISISSDDTAFLIITVDTVAASGLNPINILMNTHLSAVNLNTITSPSFSKFLGNVQQFKVSLSNSNNIYEAVCAFSLGGMIRSENRGKSIHNFYSSHPDGRCLFVYSTDASDPDKDVVYFGDDGGIKKKRYGSTIAESITGEGLAITEFYGLGNTDADENIIVGGAQDNGNWAYLKNRVTKWQNNSTTSDYLFDGFKARMKHDNVQGGIGERNIYPFEPYNMLYAWSFTDTADNAADLSSVPNEASGWLRPIYFDVGDTAYVGYSHLWKQTPGSSTWEKVFLALTEPKDVLPVTLATYCIRDFYVDEMDNNAAYILYSGNGPDKLYYSNNAMLSVPSWPEITPSIVTYDKINTIAVDPNNSNRIWIGLGDINYGDISTAPASMINRVLHSEDAGAHWTDVSKGLSALPVNKLLYRKGSNDELYAGTDVGVFKWNPSDTQWECFTNGMPTCIVMDLDFNYCAGRLRAATWGRGIWESKVSDISVGADNINTITTNTTWNTNRWPQTSVDIKPGATLKIVGDTVHMPSNASIIIEPGAHLIVDNAEITNSCESCMWGGIQARGNTGLPQTPANQGWVTITNGSTIQHAHMAVCNENPAIGFGTTGGMIQAMNSYFLNNQNAATFMTYDNWHIGGGDTLFPNLSYFVNCNFIVDNGYKDNRQVVNNFVSMTGVEGINFGGVKMINRNTSMFNHGHVIDGIYALKSGFTLGSACLDPITHFMTCSNVSRSTFKGFVNGIDVQGVWGWDPTVSIDGAVFDSVGVGVRVAAENNVSTTQCTFTVGHGVSPFDTLLHISGFCGHNIGIYTMNTPQFRIEADTFVGIARSSEPWANFGSVVSASNGQENNKIYRSLFSGLSDAIYALGTNRWGPSHFENGLLVMCNTFTGNDTDIFVKPDSGYVFNQGINPRQAPGSIPAGNRFVMSGSSPTSINNLSVQPLLIDYYYCCPTATPPDRPTHYTSGYVLLFGTGLGNDCPSTLSTSTGVPPLGTTSVLGSSSSGTLGMAFHVADDTLASASSTFHGLMDFGNTDSVVAIVKGSADTNALYTILSGASPYLSDVVIDTVSRVQALPYNKIKALMIANPDELKRPGFLQFVNNYYNFSGIDMDSLEAASLDTTVLTPLIRNIENAELVRSGNANLIMMSLKYPCDPGLSPTDTTFGICTDTSSMYYMLDSNAYYAGRDSVDAWLRNIGGLWTGYARVGYYNDMQDIPTADSVFRLTQLMLPKTTQTDNSDTMTYASYARLWQMMKAVESDSLSIYQLDSTQQVALGAPASPVITNDAGLQTIVNITDWYRVSSGTFTGGSLYGLKCDYIPISYGGSAERPDDNNHEPTHGTQGGGMVQFKAHPNPTTGVVTFTYNVPDGGGDVRIDITDIVGAKIREIHTRNNSGSVNWDASNLPSGMYIYSASSTKGKVGVGKIVVAH